MAKVVEDVQVRALPLEGGGDRMVPREGMPGPAFAIGKTPVTVPYTSYYRRRVRNGELELVTAKSAAPARSSSR